MIAWAGAPAAAGQPDEARMVYVVGIDIGGTCTDCVVVDQHGRVVLGKAFSTPPDFSAGIFDALAVAVQALGVDLTNLLRGTRLFLHSTTVAENAVVDGTLATAGIVTTRGFEDTLFAMRGGFGRWSGLTEEEKRNPIETDKPPTLVARTLIRGIKERTDARGTILVAPDDAEVAEAVEALLARGAEAIGVCLLWAFRNSANEEAIGRVVRRLRPGAFLTLSHEIAPIVGEYERMSTVALNARLGPGVARYLETLRDRLRAAGFGGSLLVMQAYGGLIPFEAAATRPVGMIESGPVSGLVGSRALGETMGFRNIIAADMGGTTFKVGIVRDGRIEYQRESMVLRYHYALPKMDVISLGLAGGSIVSVDPRTGLPRIGPRSAGSYPGPVCYDHGGTEPTITDVDAILGYLNPAFFLGGRTTLNIERAARVFEDRVARPLGMEVREAAAAIYRLANSMVYDLLHKVTIQRGLDPRQFVLFSYGGTAGMHVGAYAEELGVRHIVIPHSASVHGAWGLVTSDVVHEDQTTHPLRPPVDLGVLNGIFDELVGRVSAQLREDGFPDRDIRIQRSIDMRYRRQVHMLTVPVDADGLVTDDTVARTIALFEILYQEKYGRESAYREAGIELVSFRVRGSGTMARPDFGGEPLGSPDAAHAIVESRQVWVDGARAFQQVHGYSFERLVPGNEVRGPAVVWTPITTLVLHPDHVARVDAHRNVIVSRTAR